MISAWLFWSFAGFVVALAAWVVVAGVRDVRKRKRRGR